MGAVHEDLRSIISEINFRAKNRPIGQLHEIRKELKNKTRLPAKEIFTYKTTFDEYAFHHGGRKEIQFNVGYDTDNLRYGIAFSFKTNQTLPDIDILIPKVKLFNTFIQLYSEEYLDMKMWHYEKGERSSDYSPSPISPDLVKNQVFIFLGKKSTLNEIDLDYEIILDTLDRLLPLYRYVESDHNSATFPSITTTPFMFSPRSARARKISTQATLTQRELDINLRHNIMQEKLCELLSKKYGAENIQYEAPSGIGTSIDVIVRQENEYWFYEIKTSNSPRICLRQAIGQLLEYSFWPRSQNATRLIVVVKRHWTQKEKNT